MGLTMILKSDMMTIMRMNTTEEAFDEPEEKQAVGRSNRTSSKKDGFDIDFVDL